MNNRFSLQDHFDRATKDRRHFVRAMVLWSRKHTSLPHVHSGVLYVSDGSGNFRASRDFSFAETMRLSMIVWLSSGTGKQPKEARRRMLEWAKDFRQPSTIPA